MRCSRISMSPATSPSGSGRRAWNGVGARREIYERPNSRFVADFVGAVNLFEADAVPGLAEGCAVAVRPEKLRLSAKKPEGLALAATVVSIGYQGGQSTVHLARVMGQK